ncbi:MAG: TIGR03905 family TSCPD domain-containing protein [Mogibacterium sp.]|nr:TIGR03905 family TSCPD domain-containing protein [Mogibacterium sp.]
MFTFYPEGVCSMMIEIELDGDVISDVIFTGGCNGNLTGISKLIKGMKVQDVIDKLEGTKCGFKDTSCPDQLSKALRAAMAQQQ